jgi:hypothetical protein
MVWVQPVEIVPEIQQKKGWQSGSSGRESGLPNEYEALSSNPSINPYAPKN